MAKKRHYGKLYNKRLGILRTGEQIAVYAVIAAVVLMFVLGVSKVSGNSMEPTLYDGQVVIYSRLHRTYAAGDIASVRMPSDEYLVKRVVAVAGDTVDIRDGRVYVNGADTGSSYGPTDEKDYTIEYPYTLNDGQIYVLGDNREVSVDSRTFGPISSTQTKGKILFAK